MNDRIELRKLVNDKVPELLKAKGVDAKFHKANDDEFELELLEKLREEVLEFKNAKSIEQLTDLEIVVETVIEHMGWDRATIDKVKAQRLQDKGGFKERLILESTDS